MTDAVVEPTEEQITAALDQLERDGWVHPLPRGMVRRALVAAYAATPNPDEQQRQPLPLCGTCGKRHDPAIWQHWPPDG